MVIDDKNPNVAYIDGQNLHLGTREKGWSVDHARLRTYLRDKYKVGEAYYFLGYINEGVQDLYDNLQKAGFILSFREHSAALKGKKKGNVDCDIVFNVMRKLVDNEPFDKVYIVSGDGDYKKMVDFLIRKEKFGKMLFPNSEFASSLYKKMGSQHFSNLGDIDVRKKIEYRR
jgi:uncharacterized LabA/DUF88 family protein